jgi:hypothetical protein
MSAGEVLLAAMVIIGAAVYIVLYTRGYWDRNRASASSDNVSEMAHTAANEIMKTRGILRDLEKHPDPLAEIAKRLDKK